MDTGPDDLEYLDLRQVLKQLNRGLKYQGSTWGIWINFWPLELFKRPSPKVKFNNPPQYLNLEEVAEGLGELEITQCRRV